MNKEFIGSSLSGEIYYRERNNRAIPTENKEIYTETYVENPPDRRENNHVERDWYQLREYTIMFIFVSTLMALRRE